MSIRIEVQRTDFYNELTPEEQKEYFDIKRNKYLPEIDNIYYSVSIRNDCDGNPLLKKFLKKLEELKQMAKEEHEAVPFGGLSLLPTGFSVYKYCLSAPDLYDIFILDYLPNDDTPRILVQIRAFGLWLNGAEKMLSDSYDTVNGIITPLGAEISKCMENRIDYCYHTNAIQNPEKLLSSRNIDRQMHSTMTKYHITGALDTSNPKNKMRLDYYALGQRKSNNVFIRIYNKALEVIEMGYKGFFFDMWHKNKLISFYDRYCMEYAFSQKDYNAVEEAKLRFYLAYGKDETVKKEFKLYLDDPKTTYAQLKELAKYMPEITTIMNVEFETKRKFYYYSDDFIDSALETLPRENCPYPLNRIFKIIDNRAVFLDYLTSKTLCFTKNEKYAPWWERLRNTKLDGIKLDKKLLREYSKKLDERLVKVKLINSVATSAVYCDCIDSDFLDDVSEIISNLNDNDKVSFKAYYEEKEQPGEYDKEPDEFTSTLLKSYRAKKMRKELRLRNRKTEETDENVSH